MPAPYYAAACQTDFACPATREEIHQRTSRMCTLAEQTIIGYEPFHDVRLLAFPEFAHAAPVYDSVAKLRERLAIPLPNEHTDRYEQLCRKHGCYLQTGTFLEADPDYPDVVFNATVLVGPDGILSKYRKVNPWLPWEIHASPHDLPGYDDDLFPVVPTRTVFVGPGMVVTPRTEEIVQLDYAGLPRYAQVLYAGAGFEPAVPGGGGAVVEQDDATAADRRIVRAAPAQHGIRRGDFDIFGQVLQRQVGVRQLARLLVVLVDDFANEFLDALPIRQLVMTERGWRERLVALDGEDFVFGAGPNPIETTEGWLLIYYGVLTSCNGFVYSAGAALLDLDEPWKVIYRTEPYLWSPQELYECVGDVPNVAFPCAALADAETGRVAIYYGGADTVVCLAYTQVDELIDFVKQHSCV